MSQRRTSVNALFVTVNAAVLSLVGVFWRDQPEDMSVLILLPVLFPVIALCLVWIASVRSLRTLNEAKFKLVHELETRLPAAVFTTESALLERRRKRRRYWQTTVLEQFVALLFIASYIVATLAAIFTGLT